MGKNNISTVNDLGTFTKLGVACLGMINQISGLVTSLPKETRRVEFSLKITNGDLSQTYVYGRALKGGAIKYSVHTIKA